MMEEELHGSMPSSGATLGHVRSQRTGPFWAVIALTLPTFAALLIVVTAIFHPNVWVYLLLPLTFVAPGGFISAIIIAIGARHSMGHRLFRVAWIVLVLAFLAGMAAIGFVKLT